MFDRRLQVLIDEGRWRRLQDRARDTGMSVGAVVRQLVDAGLPATDDARWRAYEAICAAEPMPVPDDPADLRRERTADLDARYG